MSSRGRSPLLLARCRSQLRRSFGLGLSSRATAVSHHQGMLWFLEVIISGKKNKRLSGDSAHFVRKFNDRFYINISMYMVLIFKDKLVSIIVTGTFFFNFDFFVATLRGAVDHRYEPRHRDVCMYHSHNRHRKQGLMYALTFCCSIPLPSR